MKFLVEFFPVVLFFIAYFFYQHIPAMWIESVSAIGLPSFNPAEPSDAIYFATFIAIIASGLVAVLHLIQQRELSKGKTITFVMFLIFGGATLFFRDPNFIMWKPTILNLVFALVFTASFFIGKKTIVERMMGASVEAPSHIWNRLNLAWIIFFISLAALNLYVASAYSESAWVNFKTFGVLGLTLGFLILQMILISRFVVIKSGD